MPAYPHLRRGEDTPVVEQIVREGRVVLLDLPELYIYVFHGSNTFESSHWEIHWNAASETYEDERYDMRIEELKNRLGPFEPKAP